MEKTQYEARTLDDPVIKEGLCAIGHLGDIPGSRDNYFVVGGVATQSYLPSELRRATCDIDLAIVRPLTRLEFEVFSKPVREFLGDNHFNVETKKGHNAFHLIFSKGDLGRAVIAFSRKSPNYFGRVEERLKREAESARIKVVEGRKESYRVSSPEDIVVPKLVRCINSLDRDEENNLLGHYLRHVHAFSPFDKRERDVIFKRVSNLREDLAIHPADLLLAERLRFITDTYDIRALSETTGFNVNDLKRAMGEWDTFKKEGGKREMLIQYLLPDVYLSETNLFNSLNQQP